MPFQLPLDFRSVRYYDLLSMVVEGCNQALGLIGELLKPKLSHTEQMRLKDLRKEVEKLKDSKVQYHLFQAIEEYEYGHHLAAALIAGKIAMYTIEQLRALFSISRNFFTHDPNAISNALDALSLIADATKLAEWSSLVETKE